MPADTTTDGGQALTGGNPQGQAPAAHGAEQTATGQAPAAGQAPEETFTREYVEQLRREAAEHRTARQELERAQLSEVERAKAEAADAKADADKARADLAEVKRSGAMAAALGDALNPASAARLLDLSSVEWNDDGTAKGDGLKRAIGKLKASDPYLFKVEGTNGRTAPAGAAGAGRGAGPAAARGVGDQINDMIRGVRRGKL